MTNHFNEAVDGLDAFEDMLVKVAEAQKSSEEGQTPEQAIRLFELAIQGVHVDALLALVEEIKNLRISIQNKN